MQQIYETIIIGATPEGVALAKQLGNANQKVILISAEFPYGTPIEVETLQATVAFLSFFHGLFGVSTVQKLIGDEQATIYGHNVVFATGTKPIKSHLRNVNITYKAASIGGRHKTKPIVVYGNNDDAANYALNLAKRFFCVYLCTKEFDLNCTKSLSKKIAETSNIVHLPGGSITNCRNGKNNALIEVTLDTYATIKTEFLVFALGREPDMPVFAKKFLKTDSEGYVITKDNAESTVVPGVFAIGQLHKKFIKSEVKKLAEYLIAKTRN